MHLDRDREGSGGGRVGDEGWGLWGGGGDRKNSQ